MNKLRRRKQRARRRGRRLVYVFDIEARPPAYSVRRESDHALLRHWLMYDEVSEMTPEMWKMP